MGKGDKTRARARKAMKPLPELAVTPRRQPNGRTRERRDSPNDPRKTALGARCRMFGVKDTRQNREALSGQHSGSDLGMVMLVQCRADEIPRLWMMWQNLCAVERTYRLRILGITGDPKGANIAMVPDLMETDQSHSVDLRDGDERDRAAVNAWMQMRGYIKHMPAQAGSLLLSAERGSNAMLWDSGPTKTGAQTLRALMVLADIVEKQYKGTLYG